MDDRVFDLAVIGGGINGAGIARDAAGRGLSVLLCEQSDLASATSSASTKLIHGGLRYLEHYQFRLVREALSEREVLMAMAPHLITPLRFILLHDRGLRPAWMLQLGMLLYDHLGGRKHLEASARLDLRHHPAGQVLRPEVTTGFAYSDCWVDDARLVVLNAVDAAARGATILTRTAVTAGRRVGALWELTLRSEAGETRPARARALVNAAGPWVAPLLAGALGQAPGRRLRLVKGSHIVVPRLFQGEHAYVLQHDDRRIIFAIPYQDAFTLIGTTEVGHAGDPATATVSPEEVAYLCDAVSRRLVVPVRPEDVVWRFAGVRPLQDDAAASNSAVSRDYVLDLEQPPGGAPLLSVIGGKITIYRRLAEQVLARLQPLLGGAPRPWTAGSVLPGGDLPAGGIAGLAAELRRCRPWLEPALSWRLAAAYGTRARALLAGADGPADLGRCYGAGLYGREVAFLMDTEWARTADDILWRRGKLGLRLPQSARAALAADLGG